MFSVHGVRGAAIQATDGEIGRLDDILLDDATWTIRYFVVDTGGWLSGRKVLIAPQAAIEMRAGAGTGALAVNLTRSQVERSPEIDADEPVSRQMEDALHRHYDWAPYWDWGRTYIPGVPAIGAPGGPVPPSVGTPTATVAPPATRTEAREAMAVRRSDAASSHLRSAREVTGYGIAARDGDIGHVEDFLAEDGVWAVRYMVVDTRNWLPGRKVLVSPQWIEAISWGENRVRVDLTRDQVRDAPEYAPERDLDRDYEMRLFNHYARVPYW